MSVSVSFVILSLNEQDKEQIQRAGFSSSALSDSIEATSKCRAFSYKLLHPSCPSSSLPELERKARPQPPDSSRHL